MRIEVDTVPGVATHEPRSFLLGSRRIEVIGIADRWLSPDRSYFKVHADDGALYILRHDLGTDQWEMTLFRADGTPA